ncbi:hypothetical protein [Acrocarpospora catenulata]|uniref:hypothetical protein n=1 Tax=Acrocarpospora catenulata TaxID=2836182 RepID=UPI001BD9405D|nr:hypothetical protein [Acrocarpospora catenulata]
MPDDAVALALQVIADDPVAIRSVFAETGTPADGVTGTQRMSALFQHARQEGDHTPDALRKVLVAGAGLDEQPGAHSSDAARFAFSTITGAASIGQNMPPALQETMAKLAASYRHELLTGARIRDGAYRGSGMAAPPGFSMVPGLTPAFYLSPKDTYGFLKTFVADEQNTRMFDQAMAGLRRDVLVESARIDGEAIRGNPPKDPGFFEETAGAIGNMAGLEYAAALKVRGDMDAFDEDMRGMITDAASVVLDRVPGAEKVGEFLWEGAMFIIGEKLDAWAEGDEATSRAGRTVSEYDRWVLAQHYEVATSLWEGGFPADPPWPPALMKDGRPLPVDDLVKDSAKSEAFERWSDSTDKHGDGATFDKKADQGADAVTSGRSAVTAKGYEEQP